MRTTLEYTHFLCKKKHFKKNCCCFDDYKCYLNVQRCQICRCIMFFVSLFRKLWSPNALFVPPLTSF